MKRLTPLLLGLLLGLGHVTAASAACTIDPDCDDGNACTTDTCDLVDGCENVPTVACTPRVDLPVTGKKIKLRIPPSNPNEPGLRLLHTGGGIDLPTLPQAEGPGDPVVVGGSIRIWSDSAGFDATYRLPAAHWDYFPFFNPSGMRGYQYKDTFNEASPVGVINIIGGKIVKMKAKGPQFVLSLSSNPDPVHVVLAVGSHRYCMSFGGERFNWIADKIYWSKLAPAPASCPCKIDADCDDGDAGNGAEVCSAGSCS
jgi:hypothetical protein